jgi:antitoxin FitA
MLDALGALRGEPGRNHMATVTIGNLSAETYRALKLRAAEHGRSTEAEARAILDEVVRPEGRLKIGAQLAAFGRRFGGVDIETARDPTPTEPASFE